MSCWGSFRGFWCILFLASAATAADQKFRLAEAQPNGWIITYQPEISNPASVTIDGKPHLLFSGANIEGGDATGQPMLPVDVLTLGIPPDGFLRVEILNPVYEVVENVLVAPFPAYTLNENHEATADYRKNQTYYSQNRLFPATQYVVDAPTVLREQRFVTVRISPFQYNPATNSLRKLVSASLRLSLIGSHGEALTLPGSSAVSPDPFFEETYKDLLWNYDQSKGWRIQSGRAFRLMPPDSTRDWFETGKNYYKMPITKDGWYKVSKAQLIAAGANGNQIDVPTLKIFARGVEIPIVVQPDTTVEFYGYQNRGDSTYLDYYSDTSAYWLTWGGSVGRRFTPTAIDSVPATPMVLSSYVTKHFEENNWYYQGTTTPEIINIQTVVGEGWAWGTPDTWFFPNTTNTYPVNLDNVDTGTSQQASLRVRLVSTTSNFATPNHRAKIWINDSLAGEITFAGRTVALFSATVPSSWLRNGNNVLKIQSITTGATVGQFYLDWFEIDYVRNFTAVNDQVAFRFPPPNVQTRYGFVVGGFSSPQIEAYDLATRRMLTGLTVSPSGGGYSVTFRDTVSTPRSYVVATSTGAVPVTSVTQKMFVDIRANAAGADYIIITHKNFLSSAQQLAAHRQNLNGVRTKVIDVQDIYDEFNYGVLNATKLKTFLKYTYDNWTVPKPSNVLFFGDACWDFHRYHPSTIKTNYVPAFGVPASDNWFVAFNPDSSALPYMFSGRIPVEDPVQAQRTVAKVIGYDNYTLADWNKNFLFVTGGNNPAERDQFNGYSNNIINTKILPPPIGGTAFKVYKTTSGVIDGEHKKELKDYVKNGLLFMNFIGHSGGRIWGVDIGPPTELENTNGMLLFVSSVSCNVGAFAEPTGNVLAEDFMMADNRAAVAAWASSSLGYPSYGSELVNSFLQGARDSVRAFGALTTSARIKMLRTYGNDYISLAMVNLNPLFGDPLSRLALPLKPDLAVKSEDITTSNATPTPNDTLVAIKVKIHNYGLVPPDSVGISVVDIFNGQTAYLLNNKRLTPTRHYDSLTVQWNRTDSVGRHTFTVSLDPLNTISEVNELNNVASVDQYVYANLLSVVKPLWNMVVSPGQQRLVVTSPIGLDSVGFSYIFELDTVDTFNSPALVSSGPVLPGPVSGEWLTPSLPSGKVYFWRARTVNGQLFGRWVESSFLVSTDIPVSPVVRWRESTPKQFKRDLLNRVAATDSGVTIAPNVPVNLYVRSVGYRYDQSREYYSTIKVNDQAITGYWWELGNSFMVIRLNEFTGTFDFRAFDVANFNPTVGRAQADSMVNFINQTPVGNFIAFSIIFDGATNVTESLKVSLERLGSTRVRQVVAGQSWAFIGRKGDGVPGMTALESLTNDTAIVTLQIPNYYSFGSGSLTTVGMSLPSSWDSFHWRNGGPATTNLQVAFLGVRENGAIDTLRIIPRDSTDISLGFLNSITSGARYVSLQTAALLSSRDALVTPVVREWWTDFIPPPDLAISARTVGGVISAQSPRNIEVTVYNIGYKDSDSSTVILSVYDRQNRARQVASVSVPPVAVGSSRTTMIPISTSNLSRLTTLQARVVPAKTAKDLIAANNTAYYSFMTTTSVAASDVQVYANGVRLMDGDYVPAIPQLSLRLENDDESAHTQAMLYVDNRLVSTPPDPAADRKSGGNQSEMSFTTQLSDGDHELKFRIGRMNSFGDVDSLERVLNVKVSREDKILQVYNFPNPFRQETYFTFVLSGAPVELAIRIFTVSGRKIRELNLPQSALQVGFNRVLWDGRDSDGDEVANGYYFYQITLKGEGKSDSAIQKLVKVK